MASSFRINCYSSQTLPLFFFKLISLSCVIGSYSSISQHGVNFWVRGPDQKTAFFTIPCKYLTKDIPDDLYDVVGDLASNLTSFLSNVSPSSESVLLKSLRRRQTIANRHSTKSNTNSSIKNQSKTLNKPVTFGHSIKSSGYANQGPRRKLFQPITSTKSAHPKPPGSNGTGKYTNLTKIYPNIDTVPNVPCMSQLVDSLATPIFQVAYSPSGERLACGLGNGVCLVSPCPNFKSKPPSDKFLSKAEALLGHQGPVLNVSWSSDSRYLLTSSADRTARIWKLAEFNKSQTKTNSHTLLVFDSIHGGATNGFGTRASVQPNLKSASSAKAVDNFPDTIHLAQFHYMDSFVYLVCRNVIRMYAYEVAECKNVLEKGQATSFYKLVGQFTIDSCNRVTAMASVNIFYSHLFVCAGSNHHLSILDLNCGQIVSEIKSAHSRTITGIAINQGSNYYSLTQPLGDSLSNNNPGLGYSIYATVSPGDCVRIWDLRESRHPVLQLVRLYSDNQTPSAAARNPLIPPVNVAFSPCGRRIIVGATVNTNELNPMIYDTRRPGAHPLAILDPNLKMQERSAAGPATVVAWHPSRPEVCSGSHGGRLTIYGHT